MSSHTMASRSHLPTAATAARRLLRHRGAGHRPALGSCRPHWAGFAGNRRRTLLRPRRCDVWRRGAGRQASSPTWSLAGPLGSATRRPSSHELQTATSRHAQSVRVAGSLLCSHAGRRKTVLAVVMPYPSRFEREPSIDASTRTVPPLSTTATVDIKLLDSICGYDGALAAGSRGCLATRSGLRNGRPRRRVSSSLAFSARLGPPLVGADPPSHWAARAPSSWTTVCRCIREAPRGCSSSLGRVENRSRSSGPRKLHGR